MTGEEYEKRYPIEQLRLRPWWSRWWVTLCNRLQGKRMDRLSNNCPVIVARGPPKIEQETISWEGKPLRFVERLPDN